MSTMTTEQPEVKHLPPLDRAPYIAAAGEWLTSNLAGVTDLAEKVKAIAHLLTVEEAAAEKACVGRDAAVWTLATTYKLRHGANLAGAVGVNRSGLAKIKERQAKNPPALVADADKVLPRLAKKAMTHLMRVQVARDARDDAIQALREANPGLSNAELARVIGRDPSLVSRMKRKESAA